MTLQLGKPLSIKEIREYLGIGKQTWRKRVKSLPDNLRMLVPKTNSLMFPKEYNQLFVHWDIDTDKQS